VDVARKQPLFFSSGLQAHKALNWTLSEDFTGGYASAYSRHIIHFAKGSASVPLEMLLSSNPRLRELASTGVSFSAEYPVFPFVHDVSCLPLHPEEGLLVIPPGPMPTHEGTQLLPSLQALGAIPTYGLFGSMGERVSEPLGKGKPRRNSQILFREDESVTFNVGANGHSSNIGAQYVGEPLRKRSLSAPTHVDNNLYKDYTLTFSNVTLPAPGS